MNSELKFGDILKITLDTRYRIEPMVAANQKNTKAISKGEQVLFLFHSSGYEMIFLRLSTLEFIYLHKIKTTTPYHMELVSQ